MTRHTETVTTPTEREIVKSVTCDLCGKHFPDAQDTAHGTHWSGFRSKGPTTDILRWAETCVSCRIFRHVKTDGNGHLTETQINLDICPNCFEDALVSWAESRGAKPRKTTENWPLNERGE